ncbi:AAA family ATPase [Scytonema sp. UIC 10036]|uniref:R3H domain-containing nucleic acid-binding protein n=1 Tax=Scytonema sp. UIC 10036 TaxID=2304196 RepID=UPI0012DAC95E|nr:R3H domain-containing nucleic acid-binding protein [Scytonema sp. UIC 10036]MUG96783.1 AAA family ATPase [Scytonema sp. UIC 10036]
MYMTDDLQKLLEILPPEIQQVAQQHPQRDNLIEIVLDLGRRPEARFPHQAEYLSETAVTRAHLNYCVQRVGEFGGDNRAGIEQTLHRISAIRNRTGDIIGLTCRVGRAIYGTIHIIRDLVESGQSILMLGRPGVGKTTALREIARVLADDFHKRVVIIDTSNEIAGDGDVPHPAIGRARRMQVGRPELQHQVMIEAVENHMPEVIVIDEIGTELEASAARTIAERGVQLVGTAHGNEIENLIKNPTLSDLVGGIQSVTLGDEEARRRRTQKTVLERKAPPTFDIAVEMLERQRWVVHRSVADTVDSLLRGHQPNPEVRTVNENGQVTITRESPSVSSLNFSQQSQKRQRAGKILPFSQTQNKDGFSGELELEFSSNTSSKLPQQFLGDKLDSLDEDELCHLYPYGVSYHQLETVIRELNLPVVLTKDINRADAILALRSHARKHTNLRRMAEEHQVPVYTLKANSYTQITTSLQQVLGMEEPSIDDEPEPNRFARSVREDDEIDALEEARLAVEEIVIPKKQPVELLPRSAKVRAMQHELVERYNLKSQSFGEEPFRRLRIYPA